MNQSIVLVTCGQLQLTSHAAAVLGDIIRKALADHQDCTEPPAVECRIARRS